MFERTRVDNSLQTTTVAAEITLQSGETAKGRFIINAARSIHDVLNGGAQFLEFETYDGERSMIAKSTIAALKLTGMSQANGLKARLRDGQDFDPYSVLGVEPGAAWDDVRQSYVTLSKTYHPDRYSGLELPAEVRDYLAVMARRINAAYGALEAPKIVAQQVEVQRAKPIFTSPQRG